MAGYDAASFSLQPGQNAASAELKRRSKGSLYGDDFDNVHFEMTQQAESTLKMTFSWSGGDDVSRENDGHECVLEDQDRLTVTAGGLAAQIQKSPFGFKVSRVASNPYGYGSDSTDLFDATNLPGLTFSKYFVQITGRLPQGSTVYGLGEQFHLTLARSWDYVRYHMMNYDNPPAVNTNLYGSHPFYIGKVPNSDDFYGAFLQTDFPMEVFLTPDPQLVNYRIAGQSGSISMYFFAGPSYTEVIEQYVAVIGKPYMPPYWALGFHLSRWGYNGTEGLKTVWDRMRAAHIPQDVQTVDIDYMDKRKDFTIGQLYNDLPSFVNKTIHGSGRKFVPIKDPAIFNDPKLLTSYPALKVGLEMDVFIKDAKTGKPIEGKVWPGNTYFPDFTHPNATPYWLNMLSLFHKMVPFDGVWIDMNEPSNFVDGSTSGCADNKYNNPPYAPVEYLPFYKKTLCMDAKHYGNKQHIEIHNRYGHFEAKATNQALSKIRPNGRPFIYTRASAPGTGTYAGKWMGDSFSNEQSLGQSIIGMIEMNMFGIPMTGSDICGFIGDTTEELCMRWQQLGAFYPFCRNHNTFNARAQDPAVWSDATVAVIRKALQLRYSLLPHLYTLISQAHIKGTPVIRPIIAIPGADQRALNMSDQFMWGEELMVAPIVKLGSVKRSVYFPPGIWYPMMKNALIEGQANVTHVIANASTGGVTKEVQVPKEEIPFFIRGGYAIFRQNYGETTVESRQTPFKVEAALDASGNTHGQLFWDDGVDPRSPYNGKYCLLDVTTASGSVTVKPHHTGCTSLPKVDKIIVHGLNAHVKFTSATLESSETTVPMSLNDIGYDFIKNHYYFKLPNVDIGNGFSVSWR